MSVNYEGNIRILDNYKVAFFCSRKITAQAVLRSYDWAIKQRESGVCVISGFHSKIEKDVLKYLLMGKQPIIIVLARGLMKRVDPKLKPALDNGRLLFITPVERNITRITQETALIRNKLIIELADQITVGYASPEGTIAKLLLDVKKPIFYL